MAVLPAGPLRAYPPSHRGLHRRIAAHGAVVSELPPQSSVWRWAFPARNRLIAALASCTVVVEAREGSGALITARIAQSLGRPVGAVPGRVGAPGSAGPHRLIAHGAHLVSSPQDVLDLLFGAGARPVLAPPRPAVPAALAPVVEAIAAGEDTVAALERAGFAAERVLSSLAALELAGRVRREAGGRYTVTS